MSRDFLLRIALPIVIYVYIGWWIGTKLIAIPSFQTFKVLNIIGLIYDLIGVCVLSRFISSNKKYQSLISGQVADQFLGIVVFSGIGLILCGYFGPNGPSKPRFELFAMSAFLFFVMPTIMFVGNLVIGIDRKPPWSEETRAKIFGGFFLLGGIVIQIYASVLDLYN
ncbi:MAG: hypothetical protein Q7J38_01475 [Gallionella sp.]|nr:hypothetical protein [Gallionella sp.]